MTAQFNGTGRAKERAVLGSTHQLTIMRTKLPPADVLILLLSAVFIGCGSSAKRVSMASISPTQAADDAMELYDSNSDGKLSDDELRSVPGILKWKSLYDLNSDGAVTNDEIASRIKKWQADNVGFRTVNASVKLNGQPVPNVEVALTPEPYLGDAAKPAKGVTNQRGFATLSVSADDLPKAIKDRGIVVGGVYPGTYKITLSHPQRNLAAAQSADMPLGEEIAQDTVSTSIEIALPNR